MDSRLLVVFYATLICSTLAFFAPVALTSTNTRCGRVYYGQQRSAQATPSADRGVGCTMSLERPSSSCDRGDFLSRAGRTVAGVGLAAGVVVPQRAEAKKPEPEVDDTPVDWKVEFGTIRAGMVPVLNEIRECTTAGDWPEVMDKARAYDLSFRKIIVGKVRKKLPAGLKDEALSLSNAMTFDLIAVNKAARVEDAARALQVLDILEEDIKSFLKLESRAQQS